MTTTGRLSNPGIRVVSKILARTSALTAVKTADCSVAITFDDGPDEFVTPRLLEMLRHRGTRATFFVLGTRVVRYPSTLDEVRSEGHEIALHGPDHRRASDFTTQQIEDRTRRAKNEIEDRIGRRIRFVRPPYGEQTIGWVRAMRASGLRTVLWGPSARDVEHVESARRVRSAIDGVRPGSILLAHDGFAGAGDGADDGLRPSLDTAALIGSILDRYRALGLAGCTVGDLLTVGSRAS